VPINDIDIPDGSDTLYAATHGRSVWTTSLADLSFSSPSLRRGSWLQVEIVVICANRSKTAVHFCGK
jgi:hypothetical protein